MDKSGDVIAGRALIFERDEESSRDFEREPREREQPKQIHSVMRNQKRKQTLT